MKIKELSAAEQHDISHYVLNMLKVLCKWQTTYLAQYIQRLMTNTLTTEDQALIGHVSVSVTYSLVENKTDLTARKISISRRHDMLRVYEQTSHKILRPLIDMSVEHRPTKHRSVTFRP